MNNIPNILTISRIILTFLVAILFLCDIEWLQWSAFGIFVLIAISDYVDGYLAHHRQWQSALGRCLDPIADKILVIIGLFMLTTSGTISGYASFGAMIIVMREVLISGLREYLVDSGIRMAVSPLAKWKTVFQLMSIGCLMVTELITIPQVFWLSAIILWIAVVLTIITGWWYVKAGIKQYINHQS